MTKQEIRAEMRKRRKAVTPAERAAASAKICERLLAMKLASPIAVYMASADEIDLAAFIDEVGRGRRPGAPQSFGARVRAAEDVRPYRCEEGVRFVAPRWNGAFYELAELGDGLVVGPHGILEPPQSQALASEAEVCAWIVPGLAFTKGGARLGYGGGWYDRMMAKARKDARKIGVGYRFQMVDVLPSEPHDIRLDEVVTD